MRWRRTIPAAAFLMDAIFQVEHFELRGLSVPYLLAACGLFGIALYALFINGLRILRASFLVTCFGLALLTTCYALVAMTSERQLALLLHRWAAALVPVVTAGIFAFVTVHLHQHNRFGWLVITALALALLEIPLVLNSGWYIADVELVDASLIGHELFHVTAGPALPILVATSICWLIASGVLVYREQRAAENVVRKRHLWRLLVALAIFSMSSIDVLLAYGIMDMPLSWFFAGIGTLFLFRVLIADELIHARSFDSQVTLVAVYAVGAVAGAMLAWYVSRSHSPLLFGVLLLAVYLTLRVGVALRDLGDREHKAAADTPRERLFEQYVSNLQRLETEADIAEATSQTLTLGLGCEYVELFLLSPNEWAWTTVEGEVLPESSTPDPLIGSWLIENTQPLHSIELDNLELEDFLREPIEHVMEANQADVLAPLVNGDELLGIVILGQFSRPQALDREETDFLARVQERLTEAVVYSRMRAKANTRVAMQQEVTVAAAIQKAFVSRGEQIDFGLVQVSGLWAPATQCGGDWWSAHRLPDGRVLILIGDVTGHGVAAAMVTAAARGCYDVAQRLMRDDVDLERLLGYLDRIVRLVGAGQFNMTCFATLLDPAAGKAYFANAGHVVPYVCSLDPGGGWQLSALVARGNPLGAGDEPFYQHRVQDLKKGDILVWYTDGIVESTDPQQQQFGDRRLQRLLRKIDSENPSARSVRDSIIRKLATFQNGQPPADDITLVVARIP